MTKKTLHFITAVVVLFGIIGVCYTPAQASPPLFDSYYYTSVDAFYQGLRNMSQSELDSIREKEDQIMKDTQEKTHVSAAELESGIFGNLRNVLLEEKGLLIPCWKGDVFPLDTQAEYCVELTVSGACRKPWISYVGKNGISVATMYYDPELKSKANEQGTSFLMAQLEPDGLNVDNYTEIQKDLLSKGIMSAKNMTVYEKEYRLYDRDVQALVIDYSTDTEHPTLQV